MIDELETVSLSQVTGRTLSRVVSGEPVLVRRYNWPEALLIRIPKDLDEVEQIATLLRKRLKENTAGHDRT